MATVNSVQSARLPLPAFSPRAVLMYSAALGGEGAVALQLREAPGAEPRALAIACHDPDLLHDLLHAANDIGNESGSGAGVGDLLEAASPGADLALGSDASDSLGLSDHDSEITKTVAICAGGALAASALAGAADKAPLAAKKVRPKAASPNRQGPQQCQVCNKVFGNASALAKHKLTHSDERKYVCGMCAKAFKRQDHLNGHMLTHRNKKPYECKADGCGKSYCDARSLRRHTENHHHSADAPPSGASSPTSGCIRYATSAPGSPSRAATAATDTESCSGASSPSSPPQRAGAPGAPGAAGAARANTARPPQPQKAARSWTLQVQQGQHKTSISSPPSTSSTVTSFGSSGKPLEQKPVECNLCHRKFKNIPALNGHMRLHGGYFKKDTDSKKFEKKEASGPPLQTASVSVRALIEEKIISRRGAQPGAVVKASSTATTSGGETTKPPSASSAPCGSGAAGAACAGGPSKAAFVAPAPPPLAPAPARRAALLAAQHKDSTLIELLKRGTKVAVKRSASDPGHQSPQPVQLSFQPAEFAFGVSFQSDDGGYFSPTLQDEVYQVQDSTILLQQNSSDSLQFTSTTDQLDDLTSLEDYATVTASLQDQPTINYSTNQQLQAVLNSPLPESLADFSTYHSTVADSPSAKDVLGFQKEYVMYANSPHVGLSAPSPLPSPLKYHDSPSFTYPTPPASHEAQSPSISQGPIQSLPLLSPQGSVQTKDSFVDQISHSTDVDEVRNTSSPLSAAFFTTTMSSAEEVEEALEEVLPGESIVHGDTIDMYSLSNPSPPPQSPICETPLPSPLSGQPAASVASPGHTFVPTTNLAFSVQTLQALQSQMMPNSEDPLLSSSPKDFGSILVEANGEFKLIQTSTNQLPVSWLSGTPHQIVTKDQNIILQTQYNTKPGSVKNNFANQIQISQEEPMQADVPLVTTQGSVTGLKVEVDPIKQETVSDVFLSPSSIPASPQRAPRKRPRCEPFESIIQGPFQSRLRSAHSAAYTPSPILNPTRSGSGLYSDLYLSGSLASPISAMDLTSPIEEKRTPRINVGPQYQAAIPDLNSEETKLDRDSNCEQLMWDPGINDTLDDNEVRMFMELAMCAAMPVGGHSREHALAVLQHCAGDVQAATLRLMLRDGRPELRSDSQRWTPDEVEAFLSGLREHDKDFFRISKQVGTKNSKQCVQFYYFWKKVTKDYKSLFLRSWSPDRSGDRCSAQSSWSRSWGSGRGRSSCTPSPTPAFDGDEFPCKICGKVFNKVKSRSAHMKSHRPLDTDPKRPKMDKTLDKMSDEKPQPSPEYHSKPTQP